jgi:hypothetical protein
MESKTRFPQSLEIAARFPHSQQADDEADGKVENQKQVSHFPTTTTLSLNKTASTRSRSVPSGNNRREATGKIIVANGKNA